MTLKVFDYKGGDFVENQDYSMVVVDSMNQSVLAEINSIVPLMASPEGLFKRIEIGINNYEPKAFMRQAFTIYFFNDKSGANNEIVETDALEYSTGGLPGLKSQMPRDELQVLRERIENDLVAFGEF